VLRRLALPLEAHGDVVGCVPAVRLPPAGGQQVPEVAGSAAAEPIGPWLLEMQSFVENLGNRLFLS
jgi:hypothetical protein